MISTNKMPEERNLYIVGAGGFGREVYAWARECSEWGRDWSFRGFLDDNLNALDGLNYDLGIVGRLKDFSPKSDDCFLCGIATPETKRRVIGSFLCRKAKFERMIHPSVRLGQNVKLGKGTIICPGSIVTCDVSVGAK